MPDMSVTADTSHNDRSWLKCLFVKNSFAISVTADTPHNSIGPCGSEQLPTADRWMHVPTAAWSSALFWGANAAVKAIRKAGICDQRADGDVADTGGN